MSRYDDDIDPALAYSHRVRPRLICRCHSASEEPCLACQDDLMGDDGHDEERLEEARRVVDLLHTADVEATLVTDEATMRAMIEAARSGEDSDGAP